MIVQNLEMRHYSAFLSQVFCGTVPESSGLPSWHFSNCRRNKPEERQLINQTFIVTTGKLPAPSAFVQDSPV